MKVIYVVMLVLCTSLIYAGQLDPSAPPSAGGTMKTLNEVEPRVAISMENTPGNAYSEYIISQSGSYCLAGNITLTTENISGIRITADNVTLDLMGHTISGTDSGFSNGGGNGIVFFSSKNVQIQNGTIEKFGSKGIYGQDSGNEGHRILNMRIQHNRGGGIQILGANHVVQGCTVVHNGREASDVSVSGIWLSYGSRIIDNVISDNGIEAPYRVYAILCFEDCIVSGNTISGNGSLSRAPFVTGILANDGNRIFNNVIHVVKDINSSGQVRGIDVNNKNFVSQNTIICQDATAIYVEVDQNRIEGNHCTGGAIGLEIDGKDNYVADNTILGAADNYDIAAENQLNLLLSEVPETIDWPASVKLAGTLTSVSTSLHGIQINADDVTIDMNGHSLLGPGKDGGQSVDGINMSSRKGCTIRNGTIRNFPRCGIYQTTNNGNGHQVDRVKALNNGETGVRLRGSNHIVRGCYAEENGSDGIIAESLSQLLNNTANLNGGNGISAWKSTILKNNTARSNTLSGIVANDGCSVVQNTSYSNVQHGIKVGLGCTVLGNSALLNQFDGINLEGNDLVNDNVAYDNNQAAGAYQNINDPGNCTFGENHAP